jgi:hypothetical protein
MLAAEVFLEELIGDQLPSNLMLMGQSRRFRDVRSESFATEPTRAKIHVCPLLSESDHPVVDERGQRVVRRLPLHRFKTFAHCDFPLFNYRRRIAS